jgi:hypothetical protein
LKAYLKRKNNIFVSQKTIIMAAVAGVTTKKNIKGQITHVTVDVRKHKGVVPIFNDMGLIPKTQFQIDRENGVTIEEARKQTHNFIDGLWKRK